MGFAYKLFFVLLGKSKYGYFIFDKIKSSRRSNPKLWGKKDYVAPFFIILGFSLVIFAAFATFIIIFSRLQIISASIIEFIK